MSEGLGHTAWPRGCSWGPKQKLEVPGGPSRSELGLALGKGSTVCGCSCVWFSHPWRNSVPNQMRPRLQEAV